MNSQAKIVIATVIISTVLAFGSHVAIQGWEDKVSKANEQLFDSAKNKDKFGVDVILAAGTTALLPVLASYFVLYAMWSSIPGNQWWQKGLVFSLLLLVIKSNLIREPVMGVLMGVPVWMVGAKQLDVWIPNILLGIVLAWGVQLHRRRNANLPMKSDSIDS